MPLPRTILIWSPLCPRIEQPSLFELLEDHRPPGALSLFTVLERETNMPGLPAGICNRVARQGRTERRDLRYFMKKRIRLLSLS